MNGVPWGASEELWCQTAHRLLSRKIRVSANVVWWPTVPSQLTALEAAGCNVMRRKVNGPRAALMNRAMPKRMYKWLDQTRPNIVVISQGSNIDAAPWMDACRVRGIRFACIAHAAAEHIWPEDTDALAIARCYEAAAGAYFVSEGNLALTRTQLATPLSHASIVRNPFQVRYEASPAWPSTDPTFRLACVGRLTPKAKGQDIIIQLMAQPKWQNRNVSVSIYGEGPNRDSLIRLGNMLGADNVAFEGHVSSVEKIWETCHALILPSRYEGLPLTVVEAMMCGRPCIVTDVAGNREIVDDNVTGFIAAASNVRQVDEALERAWTRRDEWQAIGALAAESIRAKVPSDPIEEFVEMLAALSERVSH